MTLRTGPDERALRVWWMAAGCGLIIASGGLAVFSSRFAYEHFVRDMPVLWFTGALCLAGLAFLALPGLIRRTETRELDGRALLAFILMCGLSARILMLASQPVLEDDFYRYLWDGALVANGINPFGVTPEEAREAAPDSPLGRLGQKAGPVLDRMRYGDLSTVYPIGAQIVFAATHVLAPFSLTGWRLVLLAHDIAIVALILLLLRQLGRSTLYVAIYWWNPLAIKEAANSAHMEPLVMVAVLAALAFGLRARWVAATAALVVAAATKIWPALLLPLIWRRLSGRKMLLGCALALAMAGAMAVLAPMLTAGLGESSGIVAYSTSWRTNSALFPTLEGALAIALSPASQEGSAPLLARALVAMIAVLIALRAALRPLQNNDDLVDRWLLIATAVLLLSPAQYPWYYLWVLPLLALRPVAGLLVLTATLPLYYSRFYFLYHHESDYFGHGVVWFIWAPAWVLLFYEYGYRFRSRSPRNPSHA